MSSLLCAAPAVLCSACARVLSILFQMQCLMHKSLLRAHTKFAANDHQCDQADKSSLCISINSFLQAPVSEHRTGRSEFCHTNCSNAVPNKRFPYKASKQTKLAPPRRFDAGIRLLAQNLFYILNSVQA